MRAGRKDDLEKFFEYDIDPGNRTLYVGRGSEDNEVDCRMAERAIKGLLWLDTSAPAGDKTIRIILNTPGGDEYSGMAIYDAIRMCRNRVEITVIGEASSMGSWILQAGDERSLSESALILIHYGSSYFDGHSKDMDKHAEENKRLNKLMEDVYLQRIREKHPRFTRQKLQRMMQFDCFLTAEEAVDLGLADQIIGAANVDEG